MKHNERSVNAYIESLPDDRKNSIKRIRATILENLPTGFEETILYGMIAYVVPHSIYPNGYHVDPELPLNFIGLASQKNHISLYHSGVYMFPELLKWLKNEYPKHVKTKLDMGKSCIRFKNMKTIPYDLIGELCSKISVEEYISKYEQVLK